MDFGGPARRPRRGRRRRVREQPPDGVCRRRALRRRRARRRRRRRRRRAGRRALGDRDALGLGREWSALFSGLGVKIARSSLAALWAVALVCSSTRLAEALRQQRASSAGTRAPATTACAMPRSMSAMVHAILLPAALFRLAHTLSLAALAIRLGGGCAPSTRARARGCTRCTTPRARSS